MKQRRSIEKKAAKPSLTTLFVKMNSGDGVDYSDWTLGPLDKLFESMRKAMLGAVTEVVTAALEYEAWIDFAVPDGEGSTDPLMMEIQLPGLSASDGAIGPGWHFSLEKAVQNLLEFEDRSQILRVRDALAGLVSKIDASGRRA